MLLSNSFDKTHRSDVSSILYILCVAGGLILSSYLIHLWWTRRQKIKALGGWAPLAYKLPLGLDIAFQLVRSWSSDRLIEHVTELLQRYGHTLDVEILGLRLVFTDDPSNLEAIMSTKFAEYGKGKDLHRTWEILMGDSIFATDGDLWERSRKLLKPHLAKTRPTDFDRTEQEVQHLIERISKENNTANISDLSSRFALDVVSSIFLEESSKSLKTRDFPFGEALDQLQAYNTVRTMFGYLGSIFPTTFVREPMREVDEYLNVQAERIFCLPEKNDVEKEIEKVRLVDTLRLNIRQKKVMKDQLIAVLIAGRDPFGLSLAWALYELSSNPDIVQKLRTEILAFVGKTERPTLQTLQTMPYLKNIVREILRLYPPLGFNVRTALEDTFLPIGGGPDGTSPVGIPKGTQIAYSVLCLQRRSDIFGPDAGTFRPSRWETDQPSKWSYLPFNHGPRVCLGRTFSHNQLHYTLCRLFQEFEEISVLNPGEVGKKLRLELNIKPASPIMCAFKTALRSECL